jgi:glutamate racemase
MQPERDEIVIGILDSGVGGLSVWRAIMDRVPGAHTIYVADQANLPYGLRSLQQVQQFAEGITHFLLARGARIVVVACNTASAAALYHLRERFPDLPFVGMEPALKPAAERTRSGVVGVIATQATFQGELFANLMERYTNGAQVLTRACSGLVNAVESGALQTSETEALVRKYIGPMIEAGADQLVLGCTHYPFLRPLIERVAGDGVTVIDPAPAVARQTERVLTQLEPPARPARERPVPHEFYTSGDVEAFSDALGSLLPELPAAERRVLAASWQDGALVGADL